MPRELAPCSKHWPRRGNFPPGGILGPILPEISLEREPRLQQQRAERRFQESLRIGPAEHLPVQSPRKLCKYLLKTVLPGPVPPPPSERGPQVTLSFLRCPVYGLCQERGAFSLAGKEETRREICAERPCVCCARSACLPPVAHEGEKKKKEKRLLSEREESEEAESKGPRFVLG